MLLGVTSFPQGFASFTTTEEQQFKKEIREALSPYARQLLDLKNKEKEIDQRIAASKLRQAAAEEKLKVLAKEDKNLITEAFYEIFHGRDPLPVEEIDTIFQKYLSDGSISIESTPEKSILKLNSMKAVTRYLDDHPGIKLCNFRSFHNEVQGVGTLAKYLAQSSCTVTAVGINSHISAEDKESLNKAKQQRSSLRIKYLD